LGRSALYYAVITQNYEIVKMLLKAKANPFIQMPKTNTDILNLIARG